MMEPRAMADVDGLLKVAAVASAAAAALCALVLLLRARHVDTRGRTVLITGCDRGIGRELALLLARERGLRVLCACLTRDGQRALLAACDGCAAELSAPLLDVSDEASVARVARLARDAGGGSLHAVVHNAGVARGSFAEWTAVAEYRETMEVNFLGVVRLTKAVLPLVRAARGRVVAVSSATAVEGLGALPSQSAYVASKHALEAWCRCVRAECAGWGVRVITVNPGFTATELVRGVPRACAERWASLDPAVRCAWGERFYRAYARRVALGARIGAAPGGVARALRHAVLAAWPRRRYWVGIDARLVFYPLSFAPEWLVDALLAAPVTLGMPARPGRALARRHAAGDARGRDEPQFG